MIVNKNIELFKRHESNPIITAADLPYRANSVFNAGAVLHKGETVLLLRVEDLRGHSHLTVARSADGVAEWKIDEKPSIPPEKEKYPEDEWGVEDPRITHLEEDGRYAITFTSYSKEGPLVSLALTDDFVRFERRGTILKPDDKDAALFPKKINGRWVLIHRPYSHESYDGAHIYISYSDNLIDWGESKPLLRAREGGWWDANKIGLNAPPLLTGHGWLISYHGVRQTCAGCIYRTGLALLDAEDPELILRRSDEWVFGPRESYEMIGDVGNVVFPCGWVMKDEELWLYYGAADTSLALAVANISEVMDYILSCPPG